MTRALVTAAIPVPERRLPAVEAVLGGFGNPAAAPIRAALDAAGVFHFASMGCVSAPGEAAFVLIEASADGAGGDVLDRLAAALAPQLAAVMAAAHGAAPADPSWLRRYRLRPGEGLFRTAGLAFDGTPGMSLGRILEEDRLVRWIEARPELARAPGSAAAKLARVRRAAWEEGAFKQAFVARAAPMLDPPPGTDSVRTRLLFAWRATRPALALLAGVWLLLVLGLLDGPWAGRAVAALVITAVLGAAAAGAAAGLLRRLETSDPAPDAEPDAERLRAVVRTENACSQNIMMAESTMKPGLFRRLALRAAFRIVAARLPLSSSPGMLGDLGEIHFARWVLLPGTSRLAFRSNYDGSWMSYLEDFVTVEPEGVTGIWSNTLGFPRTRRLFEAGAADGPRFLQWAREQTRPAPFWYSAYPEISMERIRMNARVARAIATGVADPQTAGWLASLGSALPADGLERDEIPTLVFGGRSKLTCAAALFATLGTDPEACRGWLRAVEPSLTYGHHHVGRAVAAGLAAGGLRKLGLAPEDQARFPAAFQMGMTGEGRSRALGDVGGNDPQHWLWGGPGRPCDALLVLYAASDAELAAMVADHSSLLAAAGADSRLLTLAPRPRDATPPEPFGFADGVSQPVLAGTPRASRHAGQEVEPGEFVLGYPGRDGVPPISPQVDAGRDPLGVLPPLLRPPGQAGPSRRDFGRNGAFLVVRQLEQDVAAFEAAARAAAPQFAGRHDLPPDRAWEYVAAKMMGRWQNGSSLVRHPRAPGKAADNGFRFAEDPVGAACPLGSHIRRANPRDSLAPGSDDQVAIVNRHRIARVGRRYDPQDGLDKPGMLFMCLNADIERQFEMVQQSWLLRGDFHGLRAETDPIMGRAPAPRDFTIASPDGPVRLTGLPDFVTVKGGGYFFMPSRSAVRFLAR